MHWTKFAILVLCATSSIYYSSLPASESWNLYNSNPNHPWNRLYRSLYLRVADNSQEYGYDELDPLLWYETKYLLSGPAYQQAIDSLDRFLSTHAERLISDPLKRAILQRDLWAVFDWTTQTSYEQSPEKRNFQVKLALAIRRLALPTKQIQAMPNNYRVAIRTKKFATRYDPDRREVTFLPPDLFQPDGPWVQLSAQGGGPAAPEHVEGFSGRSTFLIFIRLPGGKAETLAYLKKLSEFPRPWIPVQQAPDQVLPNPELPQFPIGTQLALVRQMMVIDDQGNLMPTGITESIQIRVHRAIPREIQEAFRSDRNEARTSLDTYEFKLSRTKLFAGHSGGLRAVTSDEKEFLLFRSHGDDPFERQTKQEPIERHLIPVLNHCSTCHFRPGIHSMLSRSAQRNMVPSWDSGNEAGRTKDWKHSQYSWGLLQELWKKQS